MKRFFVVFGALAGALLAGDFLAIVPDVQPEVLAHTFRVVGQNDNGVLVVGSERQTAELAVYRGRVLDVNPEEKVYYRVRLIDWGRRDALARVATILDFDGVEYLVAVKEGEFERFMELPAFRARLSLAGWVFKPVKVELPPVTVNPLIQQMVGAVEPDSVLSYVRRLQRYRTRYSTSDSCRAAAEWIRQKFIAYGCDTVIMQDHTSGHAPNVIGVKYGTSGQRNPYAVICGHFDSYAASNAPGADDNASGTAAVIEAARVTRGYQFRHDLRFIAFSGEEFGLYGSEYYAQQARSRGDSILGVLNFDMIGYVDAAPEDLDVLGKIANPPCEPFVDWFTAIADTYAVLPVRKRMVNDNQNSDHGPFWNNGYLAFCGIEDFWPGNPWYHTPGDTIGAGYNSNDFCTQVTRAGVAGLATLGEVLPLNMPLLGLLGTRIDDAGGNNNAFWDPGESVGVYLTIKNFGTVAAHNVFARLVTGDTFVTVYQDSVFFGDVAGGDTAVNALPFSLRAAANTPREHEAVFNLTLVAAESTYQTSLRLMIGRYLVTDPIPDGPRWPPRYWAYDDIDTGYAERPVYEWVEINTVGTRLVFPHNDSVKVISLPAGFGPLRFYGQEYDSLSVSADGWLCPGFYRQPHYTNQPLPGGSTPPGVIAVNWDDLYPDYNNTGFVYYHYDTASHRLIIEYDSVCYYNPRTLRDKFQVLIYDTTVTTPTGDNVIVFQYKSANGYASSTVGIQDPSRQIGLQVLYNGTHARGAAAIAPGRAIKFTTIEPTGVLEMSDKPVLPVYSIFCPSPVRGVARIALTAPVTAGTTISVFDRLGREVAKLRPVAGMRAVDWDTRGVANGVYFVRVNGGGALMTKVVVLN